MKKLVFALTISCLTGCAWAADIQIGYTGARRRIPDDCLGYNVNFVKQGRWGNDELLSRVRELDPGNIRYPGGSIANFWDWRKGWFLEEHKKDYMHGWERARVRPYTLEHLQAGVKGTGAAPLFVLNMQTSNLEEQMAMLKHARKLDLKVNYVELGNEFYYGMRSLRKRFPSPRDYADEAISWAETILKEFPDALIGIVGSAKAPHHRGRRLTWNRAIADAITKAPAPLRTHLRLTLHVYAHHGQDDHMKAWCRKHDMKYVEPKTRSMYGSESQRTSQAETIKTDAGRRSFFSQPFRRLEMALKDLDALPRSTPLWFTEYNLMDRIGSVRGSELHGLHSALMTVLLLSEPRAELLCFHSLLEGNAFGAIHKDSIELTESGKALKKIAAALSTASHMVPLDFSPSPVCKDGDYAYPALVGIALCGPAHTNSIVLNLSKDLHHSSEGKALEPFSMTIIPKGKPGE